MRRVLLVLVAIAVPALLVAGCSAGSSTSSTRVGGAVPVAKAAAGDAAAVSSVDRQIVTDGSIDLTVKDPRKAAGEAASIVEAAGGRVDARTEDVASSDHAASARLTVRIPASAQSATIAALEGIGTLQNVSLSETDVTGTAQDLDARIGAMKISVQRLEDLMAKATTSADLVTAESALNDRQMKLESMQAQRTRLADQVDMATIRLGLYSPGEAPAKAVDGFWDGLVAGWNSLVAAIRVGLVVLGVLLPWLAFITLVGFVVRIVVRQRRRSRPAKAATPVGPSLPLPPPSLPMPPPSLPMPPPSLPLPSPAPSVPIGPFQTPAAPPSAPPAPPVPGGADLSRG